MAVRRILALALSVLLVITLTAAGSSAADRSSPPELTVATFNIHHGAGTDGVVDLDRIARVIRNTGADVVGVEEVDHHYGARTDFMAEDEILAADLGMDYVFGANIDNPPAVEGQPRSQYGTMILSKFPILQSIHVLLPRSEQQEQRGLLGAKIKVGGVPVWFYNTHLAAGGPGADTDRASQTEEITDIIHVGATPNILTGDLNAQPDAPEIKTLHRKLVDVWPVVGSGDGFTFSSEDPHERIDYVFVSRGNTQPLTASVDTSEPAASDHLPLVSRIRLSPPSPS